MALLMTEHGGEAQVPWSGFYSFQFFFGVFENICSGGLCDVRGSTDKHRDTGDDIWMFWN